MGYTAYRASQQQTQDTRDVEYRLLAQVTAALIAAKEKTAAYELREKLDAVLWNRDVWAALRVDLSSEGNNLPKELRASLISIAIWIEKESLRLLDGKGDIDAVIDVNPKNKRVAHKRYRMIRNKQDRLLEIIRFYLVFIPLFKL
jgi:flagellar protein FlaF